MKKPCWVAVDKDGTEKISNYPFERRTGILSVFEKLVCYSKNKRRKWANGWSTDQSDPLPFLGVELPKGTIEKITGKKMTWKDEPFEIK